MKQRIQGIIIGFLVAALMFGGVVAAAPATVWKDIKVAYGGYKIYVDGVLFEPTDKNGVIEPFSYNGWIYAPFEHIARALGKTASWDANTHSLYLGTKTNITTTAKTPLSDLTPVSGTLNNDQYGKWKASDIDNYENSYSSGIYLKQYYSTSASVVYALNGKYKKLTGKFVLSQQDKNTNGNYTLYIYSLVDGKRNLLYKSSKLATATRPINISVDVTGVLDLVVEVYDDSKSSGNAWTAFVDAMLE
jgi:hypothetical protein